jgi:hypothetical protein
MKTASALNAEIHKSSLPPVKIGNSTSVNTVGSCNLTFKLSNSTFTHEFFILKELPFKAILGVDFIKKSKMIIDLANGKFFFENKPQRKISFLNDEFLCALQGLSPSQENDLKSLLSSFPEVLNDKIGQTNLATCNLQTTCEPLAQRAYRVSQHKRDIIKTHVDKMLKLGIIRPSTSEWASPVNLVPERGDYRFTVDYRRLNKNTKSDPFTIPRIETLLHRLGDASFISKIDLRKGYWQIAMHPDSVEKTAFICDEGKYEWLGMPFGLKTAPSIFQRTVNRMLKHARGSFADAYLDDIIILEVF